MVSWRPFGVGFPKPQHYLEMLKVLWENRDNLPYAWRILTRGVCDGCSLGPRGLRDDAMKGIHLCLVRLKMLRTNTMPPMDVKHFSNVARLEKFSGKELRELGRLPYPMLRRKGEEGFTRITWDHAFRLLGEKLRAAAEKNPNRIAIYTTSRGLTNETYYVAQKAARLLGTNNIDNAARLCHAASTVALKQTLGVGASTCSYTDWMGTDLLVLLGSDIANNQPVAMKYFYYAKQRGARIVVVNPFREPGLEHYWVPSITKSALFGTRMADEFFQVRVGGDVAFLNGVLKWLIQKNWVDREFINEHTSGWNAMQEALDAQSWEELEASSGVIRDHMLRFAEIYAASKSAVFIWSMGLTQHTFGVENVKAVVNVALARGNVGRPNAGVVPIRGHSGVQGAAEVGSVPNAFPGGFAVNEVNARSFSELWGAPLSAQPGLSAPEMLDAAGRGELDVLWCAGGNFLDTMPEPERMRAALENVPLRVHQDLFLNTSMFVAPREEVLLLPGQTRYEQKGGGTLTSTERRIRFSPEISGPRIGEAMAEWEIFMRAAQAALSPEKRELIHFDSADAIRAEMERCIPLYAGIGSLRSEGDSVQYGGAMLCTNGVCANLPDGRARFTALTVPVAAAFRPAQKSGAVDSAPAFYLTTRRGKQFNSMLWDERDPITGATRRDEIFIAPEDAARLGLKDGDAIVLHPAEREDAGSKLAAQNPTSDLQHQTSAFRGVVRIAQVKSGTLQAYWPEANVLIRTRLDEASHEPDYNAWVTIEKP
ncbi:MAG TPA: FdhF/YdeP family oxidoreductase [Candidatus Nitrosotenuis sp.]|nr:FdhF/YdeP family oxidoreductase [Candidatus Nitrosotenuis sp.]